MDTYEELFYEADRLRQVLEYYSILNISGAEGSIPEYFIPLTGYYKEKMRQVFYQEFQDFLKDYKLISKLAYLTGDGYKPDLSEVVSEDEEIDLFEDVAVDMSFEEEEEVEEFQSTFLDEYEAPIEDVNPQGKDFFRSFLQQPITVEYADHGTFLDELEDVIEEEFVQEDVHGIFLDDWDENLLNGKNVSDCPCSTVRNTVYCKVEGAEVSSTGGDVHGIFLDDLDDISYGNSDYDDGVQYDENGFEIVDEDESYYEDEEQEYEEYNNGIQYDENGFEIVEEDESYYEDDEEEYVEYEDDGIQYDENGFEIVEEDESYYEDEDGYIPPQTPTQQPASVSQGTLSQGTVTTSKSNGDISDFLQSATNSLLTKGKRFIVKEQRKLRDMEKKEYPNSAL